VAFVEGITVQAPEGKPPSALQHFFAGEKEDRLDILSFLVKNLEAVKKSLVSECRSLDESLVGLWVTRTLKIAQRLGNSVLVYEQFVFTTYDVERVKTLLEKSWSHVAQEWATLSALKNSVEAAIGEHVLSRAHSSTKKTVDDALHASKCFIGAVSASQLITETSPNSKNCLRVQHDGRRCAGQPQEVLDDGAEGGEFLQVAAVAAG